MRKRNAYMQCNEEKPELIFICHRENNECFVREKINAMDTNIFIITFLKKKTKKKGMEGKDTQHISLCALNKVQYDRSLRHYMHTHKGRLLTPKGIRSLELWLPSLHYPQQLVDNLCKHTSEENRL